MGKRLSITASLSRCAFFCGAGLICAALLAACGDSGVPTATVPSVATTAMIPSGGIPATVNTGGQAPAFPTTAPALSGGNATTPRAMAEAFMQAALVNNLAQVTQYFAPDKRPTSWNDIWGCPPLCQAGGAPPGVQACRNVPFQVVERQGKIRGFSAEEVVFAFDTKCAVERDGYIADQTNILQVSLDNAAGRWYIVGVSLHQERSL